MTIPIIVYHQTKAGIDCPDGICAAWIAAKAHDFKCNLIPEVHRSVEGWKDYVLPFDPESRTVVFVDWMGYPPDMMEEITQKADKVVILDHHASTADKIRSLSDSFDTIINGYAPNELACGATLAWDYFFPLIDRPWFLKYVRSRDTGVGGYWQGECPRAEAINEALSALRHGKTGAEAFEIFEALLQTKEYDFDISAGLHNVELKNNFAWAEVYHWQHNPTYVNLANKFAPVCQNPTAAKQIPEIPYLAIQNPACNRHYSWVGTYLAKICPDAPFVAIVTSDNPNSIELRKSPHSSTDCGKIAKLFGGGGHSAAAGFKID